MTTKQHLSILIALLLAAEVTNVYANGGAGNILIDSILDMAEADSWMDASTLSEYTYKYGYTKSYCICGTPINDEYPTELATLHYHCPSCEARLSGFRDTLNMISYSFSHKRGGKINQINISQFEAIILSILTRKQSLLFSKGNQS